MDAAIRGESTVDASSPAQAGTGRAGASGSAGVGGQAGVAAAAGAGASGSAARDAGAPPAHDAAVDGGKTQALSIQAFYFGHSLLAGSGASPNFHIPYNIGVMAASRGHTYATHGQLGWGTPITAHWGWSSDDLSDGPLGFENENHAPFYAGRNGKKELAEGGYNVVVFTDVNGNARGADREPVVEALVGFIELARGRDPSTQPILYSCWNELSKDDQSDPAAVQAWRDTTMQELGWWEGVADAVNEAISPPRLLLVPVSAVVAELAVDAANGRISGKGGPLEATALFMDDVHGTSMTYYAAAAAIFAAMFRESPVGTTAEAVRGTFGSAEVDYALPSSQAATYLQQRAFDIVRDYPRAAQW